MSIALFSGLTRLATVPAGSFAKASFVGANTVKGPLLESVSTSPAALTAATSVVWSFELTAFWTMLRLAYMGAPPTIGLRAMAGEAKVTAEAEAIASARVSFRMISPLNSGCCASRYGAARRSDARRPWSWKQLHQMEFGAISPG